MNNEALVINRPKEISGDFAPIVTMLKQLLETIQNEVKNVVLLRQTNPLCPLDMLANAFEIYSKK